MKKYIYLAVVIILILVGVFIGAKFAGIMSGGILGLLFGKKKHDKKKENAKAEYEVALDDLKKIKSKYANDLKDNKVVLDDLEQKIRQQEKVNKQTKKELKKLKEGLESGKSTQELIDSFSNIINDNPDN